MMAVTCRSYAAYLIVGWALIGGAVSPDARADVSSAQETGLAPNRPDSDVTETRDSIASRIQPPAGFRRIHVPPGSFGDWLRGLPLRPGRPLVFLFNGRAKRNQDAHHAVLDIDVGQRDLQQCADAVIRLRAEYLWTTGCREDIHFNFTSGDTARWTDWRDGLRPRVSGNAVSWSRTADPDDSHASFRRYLDTVFMYAGSASLARELIPVADPSRPQAGDVFIQGGFPGHAVLVVDVAANSAGDRVFLLAQSYMPAQDIHILKSFDGMGPWYEARPTGTLHTPEWIFQYEDLARFPKLACEVNE